MDIFDRLQYYHDQKDSPRNELPKADHPQLADQLQGIQIDHGVIKIETFHSIHLNHFADIPTQIHIPILTRGKFSEKIKLDHMVFFDLETTGLAGGTGTYPFLHAYGIMNQKRLRIIQYFLTDFGFELPLFQDLNNEINDKKILVSYNGKSFDYPLLRNRFIMNRQTNLFETFAHLDLLHLARRAWRNQLDRFSMESIEQNVFMFSRWRDIGGWLIPQTYFEFIRNGQTDDLRRIIMHNQQDLVSLARLLLHLDMIENSYQPVCTSAMELKNLCRQAIRNGDCQVVDRLIKQFEQRRIAVPADLKTDMSRLYKRLNLWARAVSIWRELLHSEQYSLFAHEELAKYYEHRENDIKQALIHTNKGLEYIYLMKELDMSHIHPLAEQRFLQRLNRLSRKTMLSSGI